MKAQFILAICITIIIVVLSSCDYEKESEIEKIERLKKEALLNRPTLKDYMLDSKRPYIFKKCNYGNIYQTERLSVGGRRGQINIFFNSDTVIMKIEFDCNDIPSIINYEEFLSLVKNNYQLETFNSVKDGNQITWFKDSTNISLDYIEYDLHAISNLKEKRYKRKLLKVAKEEGLRSLAYQSLHSEYESIKYKRMARLKFSISNNDLLFEDAIMRKQENVKSAKEWDEERKLNEQKKKEQLLKDF